MDFNFMEHGQNDSHEKKVKKDRVNEIHQCESEYTIII